MLILVSNDDGVLSPGLAALVEKLGTLGRVVVVAPDRERSAVAHALTLHRPLRYKRLKPDWYSVDGTPTDCVHIGVHAILDTPPDLLVSGINHGPNLGDDITYSGTVGVAWEGALLGVPSFAVSLAARSDHRFEAPALVALRVAQEIADKGLERRTFLNVNVPNVESPNHLGETRITTMGKRIFGSGIIRNTDPRGADYYWIGGQELGHVEAEEGTDVRAIAEGCVSVTPLTTDLTCRSMMKELKGWGL